MPAEQSAEFKKAAEDSRKLKSKPTDKELLQLYSHYKQGCQDPPFEQAKAPGMLELREKYKYNAWKELAGTDISPEEAQKKYIELVEGLKETYGFEG